MKCEDCGATLHLVNISMGEDVIFCPKCGARYRLIRKDGEYLVGEKLKK